MGSRIVKIVDVGGLDTSIQQRVGDVFTDISRQLSMDSREEDKRIMKATSSIESTGTGNALPTARPNSSNLRQIVSRLLLDIDDLILSTEKAVDSASISTFCSGASDLESQSAGHLVAPGRANYLGAVDDLAGLDVNDDWNSSSVLQTKLDREWETGSDQIHRSATMGSLNRVFKPFSEECGILVSRGWRYHMQNVNSFSVIVIVISCTVDFLFFSFLVGYLFIYFNDGILI